MTPCQPTARLPHRAARHRLGYEATRTVQGAGKLTGSSTYRATGKHLSAPARLVQIRGADLPRPLSRIGSPTTALQLPQRRHIIPSFSWLASMHPLAAEHPPPTTCLTTFYILGNGKSRARHPTDRPKRPCLPQKFSVILDKLPLHPTAIPQISFLVHLLLIDTPCLQSVPCLVLSCVSCNFLSSCICPTCRSAFPVSAFVDTLLLVQRACPSLLR